MAIFFPCCAARKFGSSGRICGLHCLVGWQHVYCHPKTKILHQWTAASAQGTWLKLGCNLRWPTLTTLCRACGSWNYALQQPTQQMGRCQSSVKDSFVFKYLWPGDSGQEHNILHMQVVLHVHKSVYSISTDVACTLVGVQVEPLLVHMDAVVHGVVEIHVLAKDVMKADLAVVWALVRRTWGSSGFDKKP